MGGPTDHFVIWCSKTRHRPGRPLSALNATYPPAPHYNYVSGSSRESFADDVMDDHIGRSAHRHSLLGQTLGLQSVRRIRPVSWPSGTFTSRRPACRI